MSRPAKGVPWVPCAGWIHGWQRLEAGGPVATVGRESTRPREGESGVPGKTKEVGLAAEAEGGEALVFSGASHPGD